MKEFKDYIYKITNKTSKLLGTKKFYIKNIETNEIYFFNSLKECERSLFINKRIIYRYLKTGKKYKNYIFSYDRDNLIDKNKFNL